jgi:hypothetical protein
MFGPQPGKTTEVQQRLASLFCNVNREFVSAEEKLAAEFQESGTTNTVPALYHSYRLRR